MLTAVKAKRTRVVKVLQLESALLLETELGRIKLEPYSDEIVRITYSIAYECTNEQSIGTVGKIENPTWTYTEDEEKVRLITGKLILEADKDTGAFTYYDSFGKRLTGEPKNRGKELIPFESYKTILDDTSTIEKIETPDGAKEVVRDSKKVFDKILYHTRLSFMWEENEALYGLGSHEEGTFNLRGTRQYIHHANMKIAMPVLVSTNGYGILVDTYAPLIFNDNEYGSYLYSQASKELDYYFIYGGNIDGVVRGYRTLTGQATLLPKWSLGYIQSMERYETQEEILHTVAEYRKRNLPLDCIVLDWQSWEEGMWGQKTFDQTRFPDVQALTDTLREKGVHFMVSIWPNMSRKTANYIEMKEEGCLLPQSEIYNVFDEKARKLYWEQVNTGLFSKGVDAWWCDSSEPFTPEWNSATKPEPDQNFFDFQTTAKNYIDETMTCAYPLMHAKAIYEGQRSVTNKKRVVNLTRSGYTGQQKYGVILWSGDISAKWSTLKNQIAAGLNFCVTGMPYWTLDIGAFFVKQGNMWFWDGDYEEGCKDLGYRELYTRWYQYGAFLPVFRSHGTDTRREIWNYGEKGDMFYDTMEEFTRLRYKLLPYIYSLAAMVTLKDYTMMRLLAFDFPRDSKVYHVRDQFMFGSSLMVCPVTEPMYYGINSTVLKDTMKKREVYLPKGTDWYDYWTGEKLSGGQTIMADAPIEKIPLYVKAGSILLMTKAANHTGEVSGQPIEIKVYGGADASFTLYEDEGDNYNYEKGMYSTIDITWSEELKRLTLHKMQGSYPNMPEEMVFIISGVGKESQTIRYSKEERIVQL